MKDARQIRREGQYWVATSGDGRGDSGISMGCDATFPENRDPVPNPVPSLLTFVESWSRGKISRLTFVGARRPPRPDKSGQRSVEGNVIGFSRTIFALIFVFQRWGPSRKSGRSYETVSPDRQVWVGGSNTEAQIIPLLGGVAW